MHLKCPTWYDQEDKDIELKWKASYLTSYKLRWFRKTLAKANICLSLVDGPAPSLIARRILVFYKRKLVHGLYNFLIKWFIQKGVLHFRESTDNQHEIIRQIVRQDLISGELQGYIQWLHIPGRTRRSPYQSCQVRTAVHHHQYKPTVV